MKIAVTGKGGVGKSTISAMLARVIKDMGKQVIAIDADPDMNLAGILGVPEHKEITPVTGLKELIADRTGTQAGKSSPIFKMNPKVDDIPEKYSLDFMGIKLMVMGTVRGGGAGCACPENAFLKSLISHLLVGRDEWIILDMEAGIEHLGRGTAVGVDEMIVVVEPSRSSTDTASRILKLSGELGIKKLNLIGNKVRNQSEKDYIIERSKKFNILGFLDYSEEIQDINTGKTNALGIAGSSLDQIQAIIKKAGWT